MFPSTDTVPLEHLEREITSLAGQLAATTCRWLQLLAEYDRREAWKEWGSRTCAHWLSWKCGISLRTGREHVQVAHAIARLPLTTAAFERGELSYSKVRALVRIADPSNEEELVEFARTATAAQLDRTVRAFLTSARTPQENTEATSFFTGTDADGMGVLRSVLPPEQLAIIETAVEEAMRQLPVDDGAAAPSLAQRRAAALVLIAESFLAHGAAVRPAPERTMVVLHVDADSVAAPELENGTPLHPDVARHLGCDGSVVALIEKEGMPIGVGERTRVPNRATRRAVKARDRHCRWPGCDERRFTEVHHRIHWTDGGVTEVDNLLLLCWYHHHALHASGFTIDEQHRVFRPDGIEVLGGEPHGVEPLPAEVEPDAVTARWAGEHLDLDLAVTALWGLVDTDG